MRLQHEYVLALWFKGYCRKQEQIIGSAALPLSRAGNCTVAGLHCRADPRASAAEGMAQSIWGSFSCSISHAGEGFDQHNDEVLVDDDTEVAAS